MAQGKSAEEAVEVLRKSWRDQHERNLEAWNEHRLQQQGNQGQEEAPQDPVIPPELTGEKPDWMTRPTPNFLDIRPARHVIKRLEKKEYVELWHFTAQGCQDAASLELAAPDDTYSIVNTDRGLMFQSVGATAVPSSKVIKDEHLSYDQWSEGKTRLLTCMGEHGWEEHETNELAKFFLNLDFHPMRSERYGLQAVLRYQERVRRDWTTALKGGRAYAVGTINKELMVDYHRQILSEVQAQNNVSAYLSFNSDGERNTNYFSFSYSPRHVP